MAEENIKKLVQQFWMESVLSGVRDAIESEDIESIVNVAVERADRDTMVGARYRQRNYVEKRENYKKLLKNSIVAATRDENAKCISSQAMMSILIDENSKSKDDINIGLFQKLVNMTLKYLYAIDIFGYCSNLGLKLSIENIDCPLDRKILEKLYKDTGKKHKSWTKMDKYDEYKDIQNEILGLEGITYKLEYDLINWKAGC